MRSDLITFDFQDGLKVRTMVRDGVTLFAGADVCRALGHINPPMVVSRLDEDERITIHNTDGNRGNPNLTFISESGLYSLILTSRRPEAKAFKKWITSVVIPSLRQNGGGVSGQG